MINPILDQINNTRTITNPQKEQIKSVINQLKSIQNPQQIQNMILQNPNLQQAMTFIKGFSSPQQAFISLAQQKGFTLDEIKDLIK